MRLHDAICTATGSSLLLKICDDPYHRTAQLWYCFLPKLDWNRAFEVLACDMDQVRSAMISEMPAPSGFLSGLPFPPPQSVLPA